MDSEEFAKKIAVKENLTQTDMTAEPSYFLTHNKHCAEVRAHLMESADEFSRGYLFGTVCVCDGNEDRILERINITINRTYTKDDVRVTTIQKGAVLKPDSLKKLEKAVSAGDTIENNEDMDFTIEFVDEIKFGY